MEARLGNGAELVPLEVGVQPHPLAHFVGMFKDDPLVPRWKRAMTAYRRKIDTDPDLP
jgi:hypothetical protein